MKSIFDPDVILRPDGWYWFDAIGNLIGPYDTRAEAIYAGRLDDDVETLSGEYDFE